MTKRLLTITLLIVTTVLAAAVCATWHRRSQTNLASVTTTPRFTTYEQRARATFMREHPTERPVNWAIAQAAVRFHESQPMGTFVLSLERGEWGNDCSDFVDCVVDEGLGVKARFNRGSKDHLLARDRRIWSIFCWRPGATVQPGDVISIRHSPWYDPYEAACWHVGVIGSDRMVYDFTKLKRWPKARYGRSEFQWFVRHSSGPGQVRIWRLEPRYRYKIAPLPEPLSL